MHGGDAQLGDEVRILAVRFLDAAPARVAGHVDHRRQRLMRAARAGFGRGHREDAAHQVRIERGAQPDRLRKTRGIERRVAVQALFVKNHGDAQPALLDEELLNGVGELGHLPRVLAAAGIARPADLPQAVAVSEIGPRFLQIEVALLIEQQRRLALPNADHLRSLLFERHPRDEIGHALFHGQLRIAISGVPELTAVCREDSITTSCEQRHETNSTLPTAQVDYVRNADSGHDDRLQSEDLSGSKDWHEPHP